MQIITFITSYCADDIVLKTMIHDEGEFGFVLATECTWIMVSLFNCDLMTNNADNACNAVSEKMIWFLVKNDHKDDKKLF